ncbi:MAG: TonB-dependent receptor plug domain-containing protein [Gemmatimonadota bacterium]
MQAEAFSSVFAALGVAALLVVGPARLGAQQPQGADTLRRADSLRTLDTVDVTGRFLKARQESEVRVQTLRRVGREGPLPPLSRFVLDRDSIDFATGESVGDLLTRVPGVHLWRQGWFGRAELVNYQARGTASVEYYLDGIPYVPLGPDSLAVDPAGFALSQLERVEIERWPGLLRVWLYTRRHDRVVPWSHVGVAAGDRSIARFEGGIEKRWPSGPGFGLGVDVFNAPTGSGLESGHQNVGYFAQVGYVPSARLGLQVQVVGNAIDRRAFVNSLGDSVGQPLRGTRNDVQVRAFLARRDDGLGPRIDLIYGRSWFNGSGPDSAVHQTVEQAGGIVAWRTPTFHVGGSAFHRSRWTTLDLRADAGWNPISLLTVSAEAVRQSHEGDRQSRWVGARAGIALPFDATLTATARVGRIVAAPSILDDQPQDIKDFQLLASVQRPWIGLEGGVVRTAAFRALPFQPYRRIAGFTPTAETNWLSLAGRLRPLQWFTVEGWYQSPLEGTPQGLPPSHVMATATIRSKFLRTFRSGIFDLKMQMVAERFGNGVIGLDAGGVPIPLPSATFYRGSIEMRFQSFVIFIDRINLGTTRRQFVPGFDYPSGGNIFGVRWDFLN